MSTQPRSDLRAGGYRAGHVFAERFEVKRILGEGASGQVFLAADRDLNETEVALKILHSWRISEQAIVRFENEMRLSRRVRHPLIVQTFEFHCLPNDERMISMEYVDGESLQALMADYPARRLPLFHGVRILSQIARALAHAHSHGVIHRDLKPQNIMMTAEGQVKVSDFGLARSLDVQLGVTKANQTLGTPLYMSPEQFLGEDVDTQADIYALGIMAYEIVTGRLPFDDEIYLSLALRHLHDPVVCPKDIALPRWLQECVVTATQKNRRERFQSMEEMAECLEHGLTTLAEVGWEETQRAALRNRSAKRVDATLRNGLRPLAQTIGFTIAAYFAAVVLFAVIGNFNRYTQDTALRFLASLDLRTKSPLLILPKLTFRMWDMPEDTPGALFAILEKAQYVSDRERERLHIYVTAFVRAGKDLGARTNDGKTLLHLAARQDLGLVQSLLAAGADPNAVDDFGETPLQLSLKGDLRDATALLARVTNISLASKSGDTPLHTAVREELLQSLEVLLAQHPSAAVLNAKNNLGKTALDLTLVSDPEFKKLAIALLKQAGVAVPPELAEQYPIDASAVGGSQ